MNRYPYDVQRPQSWGRSNSATRRLSESQGTHFTLGDGHSASDDLSVEVELHHFLCTAADMKEVDAFRALHGIGSASWEFRCCIYIIDAFSSTKPSQALPAGATQYIEFSKIEEEMGLYFYHKSCPLSVLKGRQKLLFLIEPAPSRGERESNMILAQGILDVKAFLSLPRKHYSMKLRNANGTRVGALFFSLEVGNCSNLRKTRDPEYPVRSSSYSGSRVGGGAGSSTPRRASSYTRALSVPGKREQDKPPKVSSSSRSNTGGERGKNHDSGRERRLLERSNSCAPPTTRPQRYESPRSHARLRSSSPPSGGKLRFGIILERFYIERSERPSHAPPPLSLGEFYQVQLRYASHIWETLSSKCVFPSEFPLKDYTVEFDMMVSQTAASLPARILPEGSMRFALWRGKDQVASFALNPAKFRVRVGEEKPYMIPFHYHPTGQEATMDVRVFLYGKNRNRSRKSSSRPASSTSSRDPYRHSPQTNLYRDSNKGSPSYYNGGEGEYRQTHGGYYQDPETQSEYTAHRQAVITQEHTYGIRGHGTLEEELPSSDARYPQVTAPIERSGMRVIINEQERPPPPPATHTSSYAVSPYVPPPPVTTSPRRVSTQRDLASERETHRTIEATTPMRQRQFQPYVAPTPRTSAATTAPRRSSSSHLVTSLQRTTQRDDTTRTEEETTRRSQSATEKSIARSTSRIRSRSVVVEGRPSPRIQTDMTGLHQNAQYLDKLLLALELREAERFRDHQTDLDEEWRRWRESRSRSQTREYSAARSERGYPSEWVPCAPLPTRQSVE